MPKGCYFINAIERQHPIDEEQLNPEDNVEEFGLLTEGDLAYYRSETDKAYQTGRAVVASFGGTALGRRCFCSRYGAEAAEGGPECGGVVYVYSHAAGLSASGI